MTMAVAVVVLAVSLLAVGGARGSCRHEVRQCWFQALFPLSTRGWPCHALCRCTDTTLDCSSNHGRLRYVPRVPHSYLYLNLSNNAISHISSKAFFSNVSRDVRAIDLYNNGLRSIREGVFEGLPRLTALLLGGSNRLAYRDLRWLLSTPGLLNLSLGCLHLGPVLNLSVFQPAHTLQTLGLWRNKIYNLVSAFLPQTRTLNLNSNRLFDFPASCSGRKESLFPRLEVLWLDGNMISCIDDPVCLPSLTELHLRFNRFARFSTNMFSTARFAKLRFLKLVQIEQEFLRLERYFVNNSMVTRISLAYNNLDFSQHNVNEAAFGGCTGVQRLELSGNVFNGVTEDKFHALLRPMHGSLRVLELARARVKHVTPSLFSPLTRLTWLDLHGNYIPSLPDGAFSGLSQLTSLKLDQNVIATISPHTFSVQLRWRLKMVTLGSNPFQCDCDILWFQQWMTFNLFLFRDYQYQANLYRCANVVNVTIPSFSINPQACMLGSDAGAFTIAVSCVLLFFLLLFTILFRFRWHMRLWLYQLCRGGRRGRRRRRGKYDVFVSYAEEDARWVLTELLPVTEGQWGLTLCLHQRDFRPGKHIVDNIADCVNDSERVLLVLSPHFSRSEWCQFELKFCQSVVMERDDVMVLVALRETRSRDMTGAMLAVLRTTTYIEWEEGQDARQAFWGRLRLALEDPEEAHLV